MKARIKGTNTVVECIRVDSFFGEIGKGVYCQYINGEHPGAYETIPGDCLIELENNYDWQSFRAEAAKNFVSIMCNHKYDTKEERYPVICNEAIKLADELIKQLKEKEDNQ